MADQLLQAAWDMTLASGASRELLECNAVSQARFLRCPPCSAVRLTFSLSLMLARSASRELLDSQCPLTCALTLWQSSPEHIRRNLHAELLYPSMLCNHEPRAHAPVDGLPALQPSHPHA
jgi:hypothetical protein